MDTACLTQLKVLLRLFVCPLHPGANALPGQGQFLIVMDDESRENEGDLILPAQFATTERFAFLVRHSRYSIPDNG